MVIRLAILAHTTKERDMLARLMRAEAIGEGELGMLMVGNVVVNRAIADCYTFKDLRNLNETINQNPGGFSGINSPLYFSNPTSKEKNLADKVLKGQYYYPATNALWFYAPGVNVACAPTWYEQRNSGRYKNHCFYVPDPGVCKEIR